MKPDKLDFFRALLQTRINELLNGAERTVQEMTDEQENFPDPNDRASLESDRNFELRIRDRERKLIAKMQEALKRIDDGTFGICEECGKKISPERLKIMPFALLCVPCKSLMEKQTGAFKKIEEEAPYRDLSSIDTEDLEE